MHTKPFQNPSPLQGRGWVRGEIIENQGHDATQMTDLQNTLVHDSPAPAPPAATTQAPAKLRYKITVAYDGTKFHGWQKQLPPDATPPRTVAGVLENTLQRVLCQPITLVGASRTDTGVHAQGQTAHFDAATIIPLNRLAMAINSRLPKDLEVLTAQTAPDTFHAIRNTVSKQYRYHIFNSSHRPLHKRHYMWHCWVPLDPVRMQDAADRLVGTHDFQAFAASRHGRAGTTRTILACRIESEPPELTIVVEGTGFLYHMVRIIAGTLVDVGRSRFDPAVVDLALASRDRSIAGPTLPPCGLCLEWIKY